MQAKVKPLVLPEVPHYEVNTGKAPANDIEVLYADDGSVLKAEPVSIPGMRIGEWHKRGPGRPRKPKGAATQKNRPRVTRAELTQVRKLMDEGKSTKEIAEAIGRPVNSVGRYIKRIREGKA